MADASRKIHTAKTDPEKERKPQKFNNHERNQKIVQELSLLFIFILLLAYFFIQI